MGKKKSGEGLRGEGRHTLALPIDPPTHRPKTTHHTHAAQSAD